VTASNSLSASGRSSLCSFSVVALVMVALQSLSGLDTTVNQLTNIRYPRKPRCPCIRACAPGAGDLEQLEPRQEREFCDRRPRAKFPALRRVEPGMGQSGVKPPANSGPFSTDSYVSLF